MSFELKMTGGFGRYEVDCGVPGGNEAKTVIRLTTNQWESAQVRTIKNSRGLQEGVELTVFGDWEFNELVAVFKKIDEVMMMPSGEQDRMFQDIRISRFRYPHNDDSPVTAPF